MNIKKELIKVANSFKIENKPIDFKYWIDYDYDTEENENNYDEDDLHKYDSSIINFKIYGIKEKGNNKIEDAIFYHYNINKKDVKNKDLINKIMNLLKKYDLRNKNNYEEEIEIGYYGDELKQIIFNKDKELRMKIENILVH